MTNIIDTEGYIVLKYVLDKQTLDILKIQTKLLEKYKCFKINKYPNEYPFGDSQCPSSFTSYGTLCYEALLLFLQPIIEQKNTDIRISLYLYFLQLFIFNF